LNFIKLGATYTIIDPNIDLKMLNVYELSGYSLDKSTVKISGPDKYGVSKYEYPFLLHHAKHPILMNYN
jgi:hypothetical protein